MKTPIKRKARFNMNQSSNKSKKCLKNLNNKARQKLCEATKKRMRVVRENPDEDAKEKLRKSDQKKKQFAKILMMK